MSAWIALRRSAVAAAAAAVAVGGCGLGLRLPSPPSGAAATTTSRAHAGEATTPPGNEVPTPPGPGESATGASTAAAALRAFATSYVNWDAADVAARLSALAAQSVGAARSAMQVESAQTGADSELAEDGVANAGTVEALAPLPGGGGRWVVVTRERTTASRSDAYAGLAPAWHLAIAAVRRQADGRWVISGWQPQS